ncbi:MAG: hypothetical protein KF869_05565 [Phycisphaeraceae bacterium]|nr:hypothetical protein [Phycisphaeraceae bacterium]
MSKPSSKRTADRKSRISGGMRKEYDFANAKPNPYAARLRDKRWYVEFDPDLTELLWGRGDFLVRLRRVAKGPRRREQMVTVVPMTEADYKTFKPFLERIGAKATYVPEHPSWAAHDARRRKAG